MPLILKNFSLGAGRNAKIQCFSATKSLYTCNCNRLNLKYTRFAVMAEWLTHLTKDVGRGHSVRVSLDPSYKLSTPGC